MQSKLVSATARSGWHLGGYCGDLLSRQRTFVELHRTFEVHRLESRPSAQAERLLNVLFKF